MKCTNSNQQITVTRVVRNRAAGLLRFVPVLFLLCASVARAQEHQSMPVPTSELGRENLSWVAASAADIKTILQRDPGLMVELKRWVAKDATGHGQIISESDLTDDAIYKRLETEVQFCSVATALVQRYGYLVPKLNPDSPAAHERELLLQERIKWLAQTQEEERAAARQKSLRNKTQNASSCDPQFDLDCNASRTPEEEQVPGQQENAPSRTGPGESNPRSVPRGGTAPVQRTHLTQSDEQYGGTFPQLPLGNADESSPSSLIDAA